MSLNDREYMCKKLKQCMRQGLTIIIIHFIICGTAFTQVSDQKPKTLWNKTGSAEIEYLYNRFGLVTAVTNYSFLTTHLTTYDLRRFGIRQSREFYEIIVAQASRNEYGPYEGSFPTLTAEAFLVKEGNLEKPLWKVSEKAHKGETKRIADAEFYQTANLIGHGAETSYGLYDLFSGKEIFHYTSELYSISVPNTQQVRLIAYEQIIPYKQQLIGSLHYSSYDSTLHKLNIYMEKPELGYYGGDIEITDLRNAKDKLQPNNQLVLFSSDSSHDPNSFTGFSIKLKYFQIDEIIPIPIKNDDFDLSNFTSGVIRIERIK